MGLHRWLKVSIGLLVITATLVASLGAVPSLITAAPAAQSFSATVEPLGGLVQRLPSGQKDWQTISKVTLVAPGDQIRTGDSGAARINIVTGIRIEIYPTSLVELRNLSLGEGTDSSLKFALIQTSGTTYTTIDQKLKRGDSVLVVTPSVAANIRGTKFYTFVGRTGNTGFIGEESALTLVDILQQTKTMNPDNIAYYILKQGQLDTPVCTVDFLKSVVGTIITEAQSETGRHLLRDFLYDFAVSNLNTRLTAFLFTFLGLPTSTNQADMLNSLKTFDKPVDLPAFMNDFRSFLRAYFTFLSTGTVAPVTCGNGKQDNGETAQNCAADVADIKASMNNQICETSLGESLINDTPDCLPGGAKLTSCGELLFGIIGQGVGFPGRRPPGVPTPPVPPIPPTFAPGGGVPNASGVGK